MEWEAVPNSFSKQVLTLKRPILVIIGSAICGSLFFGCQKSSSSNSDQATTLYALLGQQNFACSNVSANTTAAQTVPFTTVPTPTRGISYVKLVAANGQKLIFSSVTTNISSNFSTSAYLTCYSGAITSGVPFTVTTNTSTNYTITFNQAFTGLILASYAGSTPTDITVQEQ